MSKVETNVYTFKDDVGKNLYRKKTYYTLVVEQDVLAKDKDEADNKFTDFGGIDHSKITKDIADAKDGVETYYVDANYTDSDTTKYLGKVVYDDYDGLENAKENGDVEIDTWALEDDVINDKGEVVSAVDNAVAVGQSLKKEQEENKLTDSPLDDLEKIVNSR